MKSEYIIVEAQSQQEFLEEVNQELANGFELVGGVSIIHVELENVRKGYSEGITNYAQAMIKREVEECKRFHHPTHAGNLPKEELDKIKK